ncbi:hypothetical protein AB2L28_13780 [Kineococcus sp. TBRC 1896]|uniref:DUF4126 domain-containing protein n=1 Tax=Kineococcus mangrovi TaxID=1660183 RepID=A0ABV4I3S0_9ACTN
MINSLGRGLRGGLAAGAVGTAVLNAVTYADMAWRGRDASTMPEDVVDALAGRLGTQVGGARGERANRRTALAALTGTVAGLGVGAVVGTARAAGLRLPPVVGGVVTGALAMAATDGPAHALGVTDVRGWTGQDWVADAVPHLAFGLAAHSTLRLVDPGPAQGSTAVVDEPARASGSLVARSALLGVAAGGRSSLGLAGPALTSGNRLAAVGALAAVGGELYMDKQPQTPSRLSAAGLPARIASGAGGALALAKRDHQRAAVPVVAGAVGALAGSLLGAAWRAGAAEVVPDWQAAVVEDVASLTLAVLASR